MIMDRMSFIRRNNATSSFICGVPLLALMSSDGRTTVDVVEFSQHTDRRRSIKVGMGDRSGASSIPTTMTTRVLLCLTLLATILAVTLAQRGMSSANSLSKAYLSGYYPYGGYRYGGYRGYGGYGRYGGYGGYGRNYGYPGFGGAGAFLTGLAVGSTIG